MSDHLKKLRKWGKGGFVAIVLLGFLYHYLYEWSNKSVFIGLFTPVNESVWEHLKLGLWAVITFSVAEYFAIGKKVNNYFFSKAMGVLIISFTILLIFYTYTAFLNRTIILVDISSYIIGVLFCQLFCFKMFQLNHSRSLSVLGITLLMTIGVIFIVYTFYPPRLEIFKDKQYKSYGIEINTTVKI